MLGVMRLILDDDCESMSGDDDFFSVASTMPLVAAVFDQHVYVNMAVEDVPLMPSEVTPWLTAFKAYSVTTLDTGGTNADRMGGNPHSAYLSAPAFRYVVVSEDDQVQLLMQCLPGGEGGEGEGVSVRHDDCCVGSRTDVYMWKIVVVVVVGGGSNKKFGGVGKRRKVLGAIDLLELQATQSFVARAPRPALGLTTPPTLRKGSCNLDFFHFPETDSPKFDTTASCHRVPLCRPAKAAVSDHDPHYRHTYVGSHLPRDFLTYYLAIFMYTPTHPHASSLVR